MDKKSSDIPFTEEQIEEILKEYAKFEDIYECELSVKYRLHMNTYREVKE
ncbi:MAG: hypothetical protein M0P49_01025 [Bacilli bacterium]|nr:hypothetical protein [Bacilli bacterium]